MESVCKTPSSVTSGKAAISLLLLVVAAGCYESRWSAAGKTPLPADCISGRWQGTWKSDANGHDGGLRCIVSEVTTDSFKADFKASYGWFFSYSYAATMKITGGTSRPASGPAYVYFKGEENLGWLAGGLYQYDGKVGPTLFFCNYQSGKDHGTFQMTRPGGAVAAADPTPANPVAANPVTGR